MLRVVTIFAFIYLAWIGSAESEESAILQYITFYTGTNFTGDSLHIESQHPNTPYYGEFVQHARSFDCVGHWRAFSGQNYTGDVQTICDWNGFGIPDITDAPINSGSIRYVGTRDMSGPAIWLYADTDLNGRERIITTPASNDFTFTPRSFLTTGFSNWTFFTGTNFDGTSTCFVSEQEIHPLYNLQERYSNIRSVLRGCLGRIDSYLYGSELDKN